MDARIAKRELIRVLLRVRPSFLVDDSVPQNEAKGEEQARNCIIIADDHTVKIAPVQMEKLRYGLSKMLEVYGNANEKIDKLFKFDKVFGEESGQDDVFSYVSDAVGHVLDGYTTTLISYGPTFGGKSFTMVGTEKDPGVIPRAITHLFNLLADNKPSQADGTIVEVEVSYVELHNNIFRNLLKAEVIVPPPTPKGAIPPTPKATVPAFEVGEIHEDVLNPFGAHGDRIDLHETAALGVFLVGTGLRVPVHSAEDTFNLLRRGESNRLSRASLSADGSTRSHAIITLFVESKLPLMSLSSTDILDDNSVPPYSGHLLLGKLHLVDLAGGERVDRSRVIGDTLLEAQFINKSLLAFGEVLHTLASNASIARKKAKNGIEATLPPSTPTPTKHLPELHVPYLDNRLTHFLKDSFGGTARTVMIASIGPEGENYNVNLHCLQYLARTMKIGNLLACTRIDIPGNIEADPAAEISIINQLKQKILEPPKSPVKKLRRSMIPPTPVVSKRSNMNYSLAVHSLSIEDIPYTSLPLNPWIQAEVGSTIHKTAKMQYTGHFLRFLEEMTFEVHGSDLEAGIEMDIRVLVKPPFRRRQEVGRARTLLKKAFLNMEERTNVELPLYQINGNDEIFSTGKLLIDATLRPSLMSKASIFDFKLSTLPSRKSFISPVKLSPVKDEAVAVESGKRVILSLKKVSTPDVTIMVESEAELSSPFKFCLEAKFASESYKSPYHAGKVRSRNKDLIANICFDSPEMDFEMSRECMQFEELHMLIFARSDEHVVPRAIGRAIFPLSSLAYKPDNESMIEIYSPIKDVAGGNVGKMFMNVQLSPSGRSRRLGGSQVLSVAQHTMLPKDLQYGWVKINSVEALGLNSLKLLGRHVRYAHLEGTPLFETLTKQDLLLVVEYGNKWVSHSPVITDHEDSCTWEELDFRFLVSRENFLHDSVRISVFNRKFNGKEGLLGSAILALQQFVSDQSLSIAHVPVKLRNAKNKVNGTLHINGIVIKDGGGEWIPGTVESVHNDGRYNVRYDDGELEENIGKDFLKTAPAGVTSAIITLKQAESASKYAEGTKVEVKFGNNDLWFPAVIDKVKQDGTFDVKSEFELPANNVCETNIRAIAANVDPNGSSSMLRRSNSKGAVRFLYGVGDKVEGNFKAKGKWYKAKVWKTYMQNEIPTYDLDYASGMREFGVNDDRIRLYEQQVPLSPAFMTTPPVRSIFDPEEDDETEDVKAISTLTDQDLAVESKDNRRGRSLSRGRSKHGDSFRSESPTVSPHSFSASTHSARGRSSNRLPHLASERSVLTASSQKGMTELLLEKASLVVGDRVETINRTNSMDYKHGTVEAINAADNKYSVKFDDEKELVEGLPRENLRLFPEALENNDRVYPFMVGDRIQANFRGTGEWLAGVVAKDRGLGVYDIDYDGGRIETKVSSDCIRRSTPANEVELKFAVGDKVEVRSEDLGYWYTAVIRKTRNDRTYDIQYADGEKDLYVPESLIRPGRNDSGEIPAIKPGFVSGDRVYVKSRSKAFGMEIKAFAEALRKSDEEVKALFGLMRTVEEEEAYLEVKREKAYKSKDDVDNLNGQINEYDRLNPSLLEEESLSKLHNDFIARHEAIKKSHNELTKSEPKLDVFLKDLKAEVGKASGLVRQRVSMNYDFLAHRSGLGDEELHALTVAIAGFKVEHEAIDSAQKKAKKTITALVASRHNCYEQDQAVMKTHELGKALLDTIVSTAASHPNDVLEAVAGGSHMLGRFDSKRSLLEDTASIDYGDIYENHAQSMRLGNSKNAGGNLDDLLGDIDQVDDDDVDYDDDDNDDAAEPDVDLRKNTNMGGMLLSFRGIRCDSTDPESDGGGSFKRSPVKSARFNLSRQHSGSSRNPKKLIPLVQDGDTVPMEAAASMSCYEADELPVEGSKDWSVDFEPKQVRMASAVDAMPAKPQQRRGSITEENRLPDAKKGLEEKRIRALVGKHCYLDTLSEMELLESASKVTEEDCKNILALDCMANVLDSKVGDETRLLDKQIDNVSDLVKAAKEERILAHKTANEYEQAAEKVYAGIYKGDLEKVDELIKRMTASRQAYVHDWSSWEEAKICLDKELAGRKDLYQIYKQKLDALRHVHKLSDVFNKYKQLRQILLDKEKEVLELHAKVSTKNKALAKHKEQVDSEAATWEYYNKRLHEINNKRPVFRGRTAFSTSTPPVAHNSSFTFNLDGADTGTPPPPPGPTMERSNSIQRCSSMSSMPSKHNLSAYSSSPVAAAVKRLSGTGLSLGLSINPEAPMNPNASFINRPASLTPKVQADRKTFEDIKGKLTLNNSYYESARLRGIEEARIEESFKEYDKSITHLIEDDYKVIKLEKRLYGSAQYYATLNLSGAGSSSQTAGPMNLASSILNNLNSIINDNYNVDIYSADAATKEEEAGPKYNNDNIKLMFLNHANLQFSMMAEVENLSSVKENIEKALDIRIKLISTLQNINLSTDIALDHCKAEYAAYNSSIVNLNNDPDSIGTVKNVINAHRLHNKYQANVRKLLHILLVNNQEIEGIESSNRGKEASIQNERLICNNIIETLNHLKTNSVNISSNPTINNINNLLVQCEEVKILIANYKNNAITCDNNIAGLDMAIRDSAMARMEGDFATNWDEDEGSAPSNNSNSLLSSLLTNTSNIAAHYSQYCKVNGLYEEEIELYNKGILFTKQRLEYLYLISNNLNHELHILQQIHVQKEYLLFNLSYAQYKELSNVIESRISDFHNTYSEMQSNQTSDQVEFTRIQARLHDIKAYVSNKMKHIQHNSHSTNEYNRLVSCIDELLEDASKNLQAVEAFSNPDHVEHSNISISSEHAALNATREEFLADISAALKAYEAWESSMPIVETTNANTSSSSSLLALMENEDNLNEFTYTIAALSNGTQSATDLYQLMCDNCDTFDTKLNKISSKLHHHNQVQSKYRGIYNLIHSLEDFLEKEKVKKVYHTSFGKVMMGNEQNLIPNFTPPVVAPVVIDMNTIYAKYSAEDIESVLKNNVVESDRTFNEHVDPSQFGYEEVVLAQQADVGSQLILQIEINLGNVADHLQKAGRIDLSNPVTFNGSAIMKYRGNLKLLRPASVAKSLSRSKTLTSSASSSKNSLVPALIANIERKTTTKNLIGLLLADQSVWKFLGIKEPLPSPTGLTSLSIDTSVTQNYLAEIKILEDKVNESTGAIVEVQQAADALGKDIQMLGARLQQLPMQEELERLSAQVVMSDEEIRATLQKMDDLLVEVKRRITTIEDTEEVEKEVETELSMQQRTIKQTSVLST